MSDFIGRMPLRSEALRFPSSAPTPNMRWRFLPVIVALATALAPPPVQAMGGGEVLTNGGFELNDGSGAVPAGWSNIVNSYGVFSFTNGSPRAGRWVLQLGANFGSGGQYQDVPTIVGQGYVLRYYLVGWPGAKPLQQALVQVGTPGSDSTRLSLNNAHEYVNASHAVAPWTGPESWTPFGWLFFPTSSLTRVSFQNVYNGLGGNSVLLDDVSLEPAGPAVILVQPQSLSVGELGVAAFTVTATNIDVPGPLSYQWSRDGAPLPGATNDTCLLPRVYQQDEGAQFQCAVSVLSNGLPVSVLSDLVTLRVIPAAPSLAHRYSFTADARDSVGSADGLLQGAATVSGGALRLDGKSGTFLNLPGDLLAGWSALTVEFWAAFGGSGNGAKVFAFGNVKSGAGERYVNFTSHSASNSHSLAISASTNALEQRLERTGVWDGQARHVACVLDPPHGAMAIYTNGVLESAAPCGLLLGVVSNYFSYVGRSLDGADAWLNASIDEFRLYASALSPGAISKSFALGPDLCLADGPVALLRQPADAAVVEGQAVSFAASLAGHEPYVLQWFQNAAAVPGANGPTLSFPARLADDGASFWLRAANYVGADFFSVTSALARLSVRRDTNPPVVLAIDSAGLTNVAILFSEPLSPASAAVPAHYAIPGVTVSAVTLSPDGTTVTLRVSPLLGGNNYTLTVADVADRAATPNLIVPNPYVIAFTANPFSVRDVGAPAVPGKMSASNGIYELSSTGARIGATNDQFAFAFEDRPGDFDVRVRLASLARTDAWASAGLVARAGLEPGAAFAGVFAAPGPVGCFFQARATNGAAAQRGGSFPVNYPDTWLRLTRSGTVCSGFASLDGQSWSWLGSATCAWPHTIPVGLAVAAGTTNSATTARFAEFGPGAGLIVTNAPLPFEPPGPCSRRTGLVFSEIMYNPPGAWSTGRLEFVEIANADPFTEDLSGYRLTGAIDFQFAPGTILPSGACLVVARDPAAVRHYYGLTGVLGPYDGNLPGDAGAVRLEDELGGRLLDVHYDHQEPWPVAADGAGHSLVLRRPSYGEADPRAWAASDTIGGSPGRLDPWGREPLRRVVINEFLAHSTAPRLDFIELYNAANSPADLSGCWLSDRPATNKFRVPNGTVLPPRGWVSYDETALGFGLDSAGERIFFVNSNQTRVLDAVRFGAQAPNISRGRSPDGAPCWSELAAPTPGAANAPPLARNLVINEIMYAPISGSSADEFIELYNRGAQAVDLLDWRLDGAVSFTFSNSLVVPPDGYIVVAKNLTNLLARYPHLSRANACGDYAGSLKNSGERLVLQMPVMIVNLNVNRQLETNRAPVAVNEVTYGAGGRWGQWSHAGGSSLELTDPRADNRWAANWADSDESAKAPWTTVAFTGPLCNGMTSGNGAPNRVEMFLQGPGECLVDNVECFQGAGPNRIANPGFENGTTGWNFGGTQRRSFVEAGVGVSGKALRVVAAERGDTGANKIRAAIAALTPGSNATLRAQVRWLKGEPHFLVRTRGNWLEAAARLNLPATPGTPGLPNSRRVANAGPAIAEVAHAPVTPLARQPVVVSARLQDPDGVGAVTLCYRVDPGTNWARLDMRDDGDGGDELACDGLYSATIPGQTGGTLVAFYLAASDAADPPAASRFPDNAPARECLVRWGESPVPGNLGVYRFWLTQSNVAFWTAREKNANDGVDCAFAYANARAIYNVQGHYKGSPAHTVNYTGPIGVACDYVITFPADDRFLGARDVVLAAEDITMPYFIQADNTAQVEVAGYWIARQLGEAYSHTRFVHLFFNGQRRVTIYRDMQQPTDIVDQNFPDDPAGDVRKVEHWFEFEDTASGYEFTGASLERFATPAGALDPKRYRWNWRPRATQNTDDFANVLAAVLAANTPGSGPDYTSNVLAWIDVRHFLRPIAVHHLVGNWDSYAYTQGHNVYAYKPAGRPWRFVLLDLDFALGSNSSRSPTDDIFACNEPVVTRMFNHPPFRREYWAAMHDAVSGPLAPGAADLLLDERYACLRQNGVGVASPASVKSYIAQRRAYLLAQIPQAAFAASGPGAATSNRITLTGTAPVNVRAIEVDGRPLALTWTSVTAWRAPWLLRTGANWLRVTARDDHGVALAATNLAITFTGTNAWPPLRLNEWMASNTGPIRDPADQDADDWFELFNPTAGAVDLANWSLTDTPTNAARFVVPGGYAIPAGGFLLVWADNELQQNATNRPDLHVNFKLDKDGETLALYAPDGTLIDLAAFGPQTNNVSQGRWPDGGPAVVFLEVPTPRGANQFTVPAPVFTTAGAAGATVQFGFTTMPGFTYQVEYRDALGMPAWVPLGAATNAAASGIVFHDLITPNAQRFYRVRLGP